jgi:hypothetical protein
VNRKEIHRGAGCRRLAVLIGRPLALLGGAGPGRPPQAAGRGAAAPAGGITEADASPSGRARSGATMFTKLSPEETGVVTLNNGTPTPLRRPAAHRSPGLGGPVHEFDVGAIGTGVAIGDYDGDGRPDIFVVSKTESCRLFRNLGGWKVRGRDGEGRGGRQGRGRGDMEAGGDLRRHRTTTGSSTSTSAGSTRRTCST